MIDFNQIIIIGFSNFVLCCIPCIKNVIFHANTLDRCFFARFNGQSMHIEPANSCEHHDCSHIDVVVCSNKSNINLKQQVSETELKKQQV